MREGMKLEHLSEGFSDDIEFYAPDCLVIHLGLAEAHSMRGAESLEDGLAGFRKGLSSLLERVRASLPNTKVALFEPCAAGAYTSPYRDPRKLVEALDAMQLICKELAACAGVALVPAHQLLKRYRARYGFECFGPDQDHPNLFGSLALANLLFECLQGEVASRAFDPNPRAREEKWLFIGDSITDAQRRHRSPPLGEGYMKLATDLLKIRRPNIGIEVLNHGINGDTVGDLEWRWSEDVVAHRPDVLSVKIGINDVMQYLSESGTSIDSARYEKLYDGILARTRNELPDTKMLIISPFFLSRENHPDSYRTKVLATLPDYIAAARRLSEKHGALFVDSHALFQEHLKLRHYREFGWESVHPNPTGAMVLAEAVYSKLVEGGYAD